MIHIVLLLERDGPTAFYSRKKERGQIIVDIISYYHKIIKNYIRLRNYLFKLRYTIILNCFDPFFIIVNPSL